MSVHVHDLSPHCHEEENEKVHEQNGPKDGDVEDREESHYQAGPRALRAG